MHASTSLSRYIISHHVTSRRNVNHRYATAGFSKLDHSSFLRVLTSYIYIYYTFETGIFRSFEKILLAFDPLSTRRGCGSIYSTLSRLETSGRARSINFLLSATTMPIDRESIGFVRTFDRCSPIHFDRIVTTSAFTLTIHLNLSRFFTFSDR